MVRSTVAAALLVAVATGAADAQSISRQERLARLAASVATFQADFSLVIGAETSTQVLHAGTNRSSTRTCTLMSEVFFLGADEQGRAMTIRSVQRVDGRDVPGNAQQIREALRFRFELHESEDLDGKRLHRLAYRERSRPTVIRDGRSGRDIAASGNLWIDDAGVVWRSEVRLDKGDTTARLLTVYDRDAKLGIMVPRRMNEEYRYRDADNQRMAFVTSEATYSAYRRFETSARIVTP